MYVKEGKHMHGSAVIEKFVKDCKTHRSILEQRTVARG